MAVTKVDLPLGPIDEVRSVELELEMKARHYQQIVMSSTDMIDRTLISILNELIVDGTDVFSLNRKDYEYLVALIRVATFGPEVSLDWVHRVRKDGSKCGCHNQVTLDLSTFQPKEFRSSLPKVSVLGKTYYVRPCSMETEISVVESLVGTSSRADFFSSLDNVAKYTDAKLSTYLVDSSGSRVATDLASATDFYKSVIAECSVQEYRSLISVVNDLDSYGYSFEAEAVCSKCKEEGSYRVPFQNIIYSAVV